jgi:hypothetical protein
MSDWNFNMDDAPRGHFQDVTRQVGKNVVCSVVHVPERIIAAGNEGVVTVSRWLDAEKRWEMFTAEVPPLAWMPWPQHPGGAQ